MQDCPYKQNDNGVTMQCSLLREIGGPTVLAGSSRPSYLCPRCQAEWTGLPSKNKVPEILKKVAEGHKTNLERPGLIQLGTNFMKAAIKHVANGMPEVSQQDRKIRLKICGEGEPLENQCEMYKDGVCVDPKCGCNVAEKSKWATEDCPQNKWPKNKFTDKKGGCGSCGTS